VGSVSTESAGCAWLWATLTAFDSAVAAAADTGAASRPFDSAGVDARAPLAAGLTRPFGCSAADLARLATVAACPFDSVGATELGPLALGANGPLGSAQKEQALHLQYLCRCTVRELRRPHARPRGTKGGPKRLEGYFPSGHSITLSACHAWRGILPEFRYARQRAMIASGSPATISKPMDCGGRKFAQDGAGSAEGSYRKVRKSHT